MVRLSPDFSPALLKGLKVHPEDPFQFDFILDKGESQLADEALKDESNKLIKYFLASLTVPEGDLWVNLSPYEKDRIVPESFGQTDMGRDLLAQDYLLKQITASLIYPEDEFGQKFWKRVYEEATAKFGTTDIPVNTFNKVWIVPSKAVLYENAKAGTAYVVESRLKVMLEEDYLAIEKSGAGPAPAAPRSSSLSLRANVVPASGSPATLASQVIREIVIPQLEKEVNEGKNFAQLRQVYSSLILAAWYKKKIKDSVLSQVYADKNKIAGINIEDPQEKQKIYEQYVKAFKKGVYNYIKEEQDPATGTMIPRKYFSGGFKMDMAMLDTTVDEGAMNKVSQAGLIDLGVSLSPFGRDRAMSSDMGRRQFLSKLGIAIAGVSAGVMLPQDLMGASIFSKRRPVIVLGHEHGDLERLNAYLNRQMANDSPAAAQKEIKSMLSGLGSALTSIRKEIPIIEEAVKGSAKVKTIAVEATPQWLPADVDKVRSKIDRVRAIMQEKGIERQEQDNVFLLSLGPAVYMKFISHAALLDNVRIVGVDDAGLRKEGEEAGQRLIFAITSLGEFVSGTELFKQIRARLDLLTALDDAGRRGQIKAEIIGLAGANNELKGRMGLVEEAIAAAEQNKLVVDRRSKHMANEVNKIVGPVLFTVGKGHEVYFIKSLPTDGNKIINPTSKETLEGMIEKLKADKAMAAAEQQTYLRDKFFLPLLKAARVGSSDGFASRNMSFELSEDLVSLGNAHKEKVSILTWFAEEHAKKRITDAQMAYVIAHEVAHVRNEKSLRGVSTRSEEDAEKIDSLIAIEIMLKAKIVTPTVILSEIVPFIRNSNALKERAMAEGALRISTAQYAAQKDTHPYGVIAGAVERYMKRVQSSDQDDPAMAALKKVGGIDFNSDKMKVEITNEGQGIKFDLDPIVLEQFRNAPGFEPVITRVQPLKDLPVFLGITNSP